MCIEFNPNLFSIPVFSRGRQVHSLRRNDGIAKGSVDTDTELQIQREYARCLLAQEAVWGQK